MATKIGNTEARSSHRKANRPYLLSKLDDFKDAVNMACFVPHEDAVITVSSDKYVFFFPTRGEGLSKASMS